MKMLKKFIRWAVTRCDHCGKMTDADGNYCEYCGERL